MLRSRRKAKKLHREEYEANDFSGRLVTLQEPDGLAAEAYRTLRTNLLYAFVDTPPEVIVLTSPGPGEGKSTICANLGVVLSQADKRVLIVDCDLRKPVMHKVFGLRNMQGVVNVVVGERDLREVWEEPLPGLKVLTTGPVPPRPAELLSSERFTEFLDQARREFDYVLLDTSPIELVSDPVVLATQSDGVLLILDAQKTRKSSVRQSMRSLETVGARILGTVVNNMEPSKQRSYQLYSYT